MAEEKSDRFAGFPFYMFVKAVVSKSISNFTSSRIQSTLNGYPDNIAVVTELFGMNPFVFEGATTENIKAIIEFVKKLLENYERHYIYLDHNENKIINILLNENVYRYSNNVEVLSLLTQMIQEEKIKQIKEQHQQDIDEIYHNFERLANDFQMQILNLQEQIHRLQNNHGNFY